MHLLSLNLSRRRPQRCVRAIAEQFSPGGAREQIHCKSVAECEAELMLEKTYQIRTRRVQVVAVLRLMEVE